MTLESIFLIWLLVTILISWYLFRKRILNEHLQLKEKREGLEESINLLEEEIIDIETVTKELPLKVKKIFSIKDVIGSFAELIDPVEVKRFLVNNLANIFSEATNILLFLFIPEKNSLVLVESIRRHCEVVREKKGDVLDWWILRHNRCLLIKDLATDYRFDRSEIIAYQQRGVRAILSSPISIGSRILGVTRLESEYANMFSLEDSRALRVICDLAAVILERANLFQKIKELAIKDSLTGLYLRNYFFERFDEEIKRASLKRSWISLGVLDIDNFKKINDVYGHTVGDMILRRLAEILRRNVNGAGDLVARIGGEEFAFFLIEKDKTDAIFICEAIRRRIESTKLNIRRRVIQFTVSIGVVSYPVDGVDTQQLFSSADSFLYKAKQEGKNKVCFS